MYGYSMTHNIISYKILCQVTDPHDKFMQTSLTFSISVFLFDRLLSTYHTVVQHVQYGYNYGPAHDKNMGTSMA
jgi:hypothetical protein